MNKLKVNKHEKSVIKLVFSFNPLLVVVGVVALTLEASEIKPLLIAAENDA